MQLRLQARPCAVDHLDPLIGNGDEFDWQTAPGQNVRMVFLHQFAPDFAGFVDPGTALQTQNGIGIGFAIRR